MPERNCEVFCRLNSRHLHRRQLKQAADQGRRSLGLSLWRPVQRERQGVTNAGFAALQDIFESINVLLAYVGLPDENSQQKELKSWSLC